MQCESCGDTISLSTAHRRDGQFVCPDCHAGSQPQPQQSQAQMQQQPSARDQNASSRPRSSPDRQQRSSGSSAQQRGSRKTSDGGAVAGSPTNHRETPRTWTNRSSNGARQIAADGAPAEQKFNALRRLGKFIAGTGWVVVLLGILTCLAGGGLASEGGMASVAGLIGLPVGLVTAALGLLLAASGQQISCFVAIERNTRSTYELIRAQQE